jgi:uncharacterized protein (TIGR03067 family)
MAHSLLLMLAFTVGQTDAKGMEGTWVLGFDGKEKDFKLIIAANGKYEKRLPSWTERGTIAIDTSKAPKTIDFAVTKGPSKGKVKKGIFLVDTQDSERIELKICVAAPDKDRPTAFDGQEGAIEHWYKKK